MYGDPATRTCKLFEYLCSIWQISPTTGLQECLTCTDIRIDPSQGCNCPIGYYSENNISRCFSCYYKCGTCDSFSTNTASCKTCGSYR
jgi:hypothetical protein